MNKSLIDYFLRWWVSRSPSIADQIFHSDASYTDCIGSGLIPAGGTRGPSEEDAVGLVLQKIVLNGNEATVVFEEIDEITELLCRQAIYLRSEDGKLAEVIHIKESVARPGGFDVKGFR